MNEREDVDNQNTRVILDSIRDLKSDMDSKMNYITTKLDENITATGKQEASLTAAHVKIGTLENNVTKLWGEVDKLRSGQAKIETEMASHLSSETTKETTEEKGKENKFNWLNLLTPAILTLGLAIIGFIIGGQDGGKK